MRANKRIGRGREEGEGSRKGYGALTQEVGSRDVGHSFHHL